MTSAAFRRRRDAEEDGAEHEENQRQRRDQHDDHLLGQPRHHVDVHRLVDESHDIDEGDAAGSAEDIGIGTLCRGEIDVRRIGKAASNQKRDDQRCHAGTKRARLQRQGRHRIPLEEGHQQDIAHVEARQDETRDECTGIHVTNRAAELVGENDQHERRRNDLR
jgi:hypothetical protein